MTSMNFPTLPYDHVTNSFLLEICFWGPTYPTFLYDVTLFSLFFLNSSLSRPSRIQISLSQNNFFNKEFSIDQMNLNPGVRNFIPPAINEKLKKAKQFLSAK